jgi:hypothetical protein
MATSKKSTGETLFDLTSYVADTPANHSQQQENEMALMTHDTYGLGYAKPLANYDLDTRSWRMYEATLLSDSPPFSGSWPASGMTLNGKLFPQTLLVRHISENELSSWPTPVSSSSMDEDISTVRSRLDKGKPYKSRLIEAIALAPTPSGNWPTPLASDVYTDNLKSSQQKDGSMHSVSLGQAVQMWPTPRSNTAMASLITPEIANDPKRFPNLETVVGRREQVTGRLNPMWVEWLMGFPLGWTDLED